MNTNHIVRIEENQDAHISRCAYRASGDMFAVAMNILVVPDKFKGTLTARAAADAIARGWRSARPKDRLVLLPMSDGGDGFGSVMGTMLNARRHADTTLDAAHRPCKSHWWWHAKTKTAVVESAAVIGLAMLPHGRFHPFQLDTFGLGKILRAAIKRGARRILVGIGGSATNDGGFGMACALGWRFLDATGRVIEQWTELHRLNEIRPPSPARRSSRIQIIVASDVENPLLGDSGATRVYGPQKGMRPRDFAAAESALSRLALTVREQFNRDFATMPGAGAAGGLGFGLAAFLGAKFESGFDMFAELSDLEARLRKADLVITAEGRMDPSSLMGKGAGQVAVRCSQFKVPCIGLAGDVTHPRALRRLFKQG
ncbi:MAG TPA: glycerate kinase [Verrucomicrobiota bacterium]|nr:glycerate kinase [Verrucomicrobiota bacterium]